MNVHRKKISEISVVIPCYNHGDYLEESVASVLAQTLPAREIIIVNDGSTDNTVKVSDRLIEENKDLIFRVDQENMGLSCRNSGIKIASSNYIFTLDADDKIDRKTLEKMSHILDTHHEVGLVYGHTRIFGDMNFTVKVPEFSEKWLLTKGNVGSMVMFRKKAWEDAGGYNPNMSLGYEDWDLALGIYEKGWKLYNTKKAFGFYRKSGISMVQNSLCHDSFLKAQLIVNHKSLFTGKDILQAENTLKDYKEAGLLGTLKEGPKVSVICLPGSTESAKAVSAINNQIYKNLEILVISRENNPVTASLPFLYPATTIEVSSSCTEGRALNLAIKKSSGSFIAFLDAETVWTDFHISSLMEFILKSDSNITHSEGSLKLFVTKGKTTTLAKMIPAVSEDRPLPLSSLLQKKSVLPLFFDDKLNHLTAWDYQMKVSTKHKLTKLKKITFEQSRMSLSQTLDSKKALLFLKELEYILSKNPVQSGWIAKEELAFHVKHLFRDILFCTTVHKPMGTMFYLLLCVTGETLSKVFSPYPSFLKEKLTGISIFVKRYFAKKIKMFLGMKEIIAE